MRGDGTMKVEGGVTKMCVCVLVYIYKNKEQYCMYYCGSYLFLVFILLIIFCRSF